MLVNKSGMGLNCTEAVTLDAATRRRYFADIASLVGNVRVEFPWRAIMPGTAAASETLQVTIPVVTASGAKTTVTTPAVTVGGATAFTWTLPDAIMADARAAGLKVTVVFAHPPNDPLGDALGIPAAPPGAAQFGTLVRACADRYRDVVAWEMWNEPNLHAFFPGANPTEYVPYLKAGYQAAKAVTPDAKVLFGGLASAATASGLISWWAGWWNNTDPVEFLTRSYAAGAKGYFDALAYHPYSVTRDFKSLPFSPTNEYIADIAKLRDVMAANGDTKPIWATEYGFDSTITTPTQSSELAAQTDYMATLPYVDKAYIYNYADASGEALGITVNGTPKPSYTWLKNRMA